MSHIADLTPEQIADELLDILDSAAKSRSYSPAREAVAQLMRTQLTDEQAIVMGVIIDKLPETERPAYWDDNRVTRDVQRAYGPMIERMNSARLLRFLECTLTGRSLPANGTRSVVQELFIVLTEASITPEDQFSLLVLVVDTIMSELETGRYDEQLIDHYRKVLPCIVGELAMASSSFAYAKLTGIVDRCVNGGHFETVADGEVTPPPSEPLSDLLENSIRALVQLFNRDYTLGMNVQRLTGKWLRILEERGATKTAISEVERLRPQWV